MPIGQRFGATSDPWEVAAVRTASHTEIAPGLTIRHASAPGFLALKFAAFRDRGSHDPHLSTDLEDILALLASRPRIVEEMLNAPEEIRAFVAYRASALLEMDVFEDLLAGHLANVARQRAAQVIPAAEQRLRAIAFG